VLQRLSTVVKAIYFERDAQDFDYGALQAGAFDVDVAMCTEAQAYTRHVAITGR
jgi:hypothetical protein